MSRKSTSIWDHYRHGWTVLLANWRVILTVYGMNLFLAFVAMGPLSNVMKKAFGYSPLQEQFVSSFDYTFIMDFLHQYGTSVGLSMTVMGSFVVLYFFWNVFFTGGYMGIIQQRSGENNYCLLYTSPSPRDS